MAFDINNLNVSGTEYLQGVQNLNNRQAKPVSGISGQSLMSGLAQAFQGLTMANEGAQIALEGSKFQAGMYRAAGQMSKAGADLQAKVYRQAGDAAIVATNYNIALDQVQTDRQQDATGRALFAVTSTNWTNAAANGISVTSRSVLSVQTAVFNEADRMFVQTKNDARQRQVLMKYQGELTKMQYENEARASEYSGMVSKYNYETQALMAEYQGKVQAHQARSQALQSIGNTAMSFFS